MAAETTQSLPIPEASRELWKDTGSKACACVLGLREINYFVLITMIQFVLVNSIKSQLFLRQFREKK